MNSVIVHSMVSSKYHAHFAFHIFVTAIISLLDIAANSITPMSAGETRKFAFDFKENTNCHLHGKCLLAELGYPVKHVELPPTFGVKKTHEFQGTIYSTQYIIYLEAKPVGNVVPQTEILLGRSVAKQGHVDMLQIAAAGQGCGFEKMLVILNLIDDDVNDYGLKHFGKYKSAMKAFESSPGLKHIVEKWCRHVVYIGSSAMPPELGKAYIKAAIQAQYDKVITFKESTIDGSGYVLPLTSALGLYEKSVNGDNCGVSAFTQKYGLHWFFCNTEGEYKYN